VTTLNIVASQL